MSNNIFDIWQERLASDSEAAFLKVAHNQETRVAQYPRSAFYKRAARAAVALRQVLKLPAGARVLLCMEDPNEMALLLHGSLLAGLVAVPVEEGLSTEELKKILQTTKPSAVIFPPSLSANAVTLLPAAPSVKHWVVTGRQEPGKKQAPGGIKRLETVLLSIAGEELVPKDIGKGGLLCRKSGSSGLISITSEQLMKKTQRTADILAPACDKGILWSSFDDKSLASVLHQFFLPLFIDIPVLVRDGVQVPDFWPQMLADSVRTAIISFEQLSELFKKGKARGWRKSDFFQILVCDHHKIDSDIMEEFTDRFHTDVGVACLLPDYAEYLSFRSPNEQDFEYITDEGGKTLISYGRTVAKVKIDPKPLPGVAAKTSVEWGELVVAQNERPYSTGIRAALQKVSAPGGESYHELFLMGKETEIIVRNSKVISLARVNTLLKQLTGIIYGRAVSYSHPSKGQDYSIYVIPHRLSDMNKYDVEMALAESIPMEERPADIVLGERGSKEIPESDDELRLLVTT